MRLLTPLPFRTDWTPEQAMAIHQWLLAMAEAIHDYYHHDLYDPVDEPQDPSLPIQAPLFDDDLPF